MPNDDAVELLRKVVNLPDCQKMNLSTVKGYLGELLVKKLLEGEGQTVKHLENQYGYDLMFSSKGTEIRADVKMSTLKDEFNWGFEYWGWALKHESKKKPISATHFVCVGCDKGLTLQEVFIVRASDVIQFPPGEKQFKKVVHGLILAPVEPTRSLQPQTSELYARSQALLENGTVRRLSSGLPLSEALLAS